MRPARRGSYATEARADGLIWPDPRPLTLPPSTTHPPRAPDPGPISVVLCTWNGVRWLAELLRSLSDQVRPPDELIVQDDDSDDETVGMIEQFADGAAFPVRLQRNAARLGSTRNFGVALARAQGEVVALADQDDLWYPTKLARLSEEFAADPTITMVFSDADLIDEDGHGLDRRLWSTRMVGRALYARSVVSVRDFARRPLTTGCTMAVRRRAVEAALPLPHQLDHPDVPLRHDRWLSLVAAAVGTVRTLPEPLLAFRVHPAQETGVLIDRERRRAFGRAARGVLAGTSSVEEHEVRAEQLDAAAQRADLLGDFESARVLRTIAGHHQHRAAVSGGRAPLRAVAAEVRHGRYGDDRFAAAAAAADVVRVARSRWT